MILHPSKLKPNSTNPSKNNKDNRNSRPKIKPSSYFVNRLNFYGG